MYLGTELAGQLNHTLVKPPTETTGPQPSRETGWGVFWLVPCIGAAVCLLLFLLLF
jgi:hypothetical protein